MTRKILQNLKLIFFPCKENNFKARLLGGDFLFRLVLVFFILRIVVLPFYVYFPKSAFFAQVVSSDILELLNKERRTLGLAPLREDPKLKRAAYLKAQDMLKHDYFGHKSPSGVSGWYWIQKSGYDYEIAGENLAIGFLDSKEVHQAWNDSPSHRQNLLAPYFQDVGIAAITGEFQGNETTIVVQFFSKPQGKLAVAEKIVPPVEAKTEEPEEPEEPAKTEEPKEAAKTEEEEIKETEEIETQEETPEDVMSEIAPQVSIVPEKKDSSFQSKFWEFLIKRYSDFLQKTIFFITFLMIFVFALNLLWVLGSPFSFATKQVLLREIVPGTLLAVVFLTLLGFFDKSIIVQFIPHYLEI